MTIREELHHIVDDLPDSELATAKRFLVYLSVTSRDALLCTLLDAPEDDEPETPEEAEGMAEAYEDVRAGRLVSHEEARRRLLGQP